jgi:hypothetical protein
MKINMQAALSSEDIIEAIADFVSEKTGSQVNIDAVELDSNEHGIWAKVTVEADSDALVSKPSKKKASAKRTAPKLASVKTEETSEAVEEEVIEETETPEVSDTPQESDTADEAGPTAEETLSELKAAAAGKGNIFNRKTS